jgi:hypothetical protein
MKRMRCAILLFWGVLALWLSYAPSAHADVDPDKVVSLRMCNNGDIQVDAVENWVSDDRIWHVIGWIAIPAHECNYMVAQLGGASPVYFGFAYTDSGGVWGPATASIPGYANSKGAQLFSQTDRQVCVRHGDMMYATKDSERANDCASLQLANEPEGKSQFFAFPTTLYFQPEMKKCPLLGPCIGGSYAIEIAPSVQSHVLTVKRALTDEERGWKMVGDFMKMLEKAGAEVQEKKAQAAAEATAAAAAAAAAASPEGQLQRARQASTARNDAQNRIKAAAAAGDPSARVPAQMIAREEDDNRQRWAGTRQSPAAYDPHWTGQNMVVIGTISRIDVDSEGSPRWLTIHFKESPHSAFVVCSPYPDMFQERVGLDLNVLVGKTLRAAGQIESPYCGGDLAKGSIRVVESTQWQID